MIKKMKKLVSPTTKKRFKKTKSAIENFLVAVLMRLKHKILLKRIQKKERIKVVFLVMKSSMWKLDEVFKKMLDDPYFDPLILVCPYISEGEEQLFRDLNNTYRYFVEKGYPVKLAYKKNTNSWITLEEIAPDLIFFGNPHKATLKEYYKKAFFNYLACYLPYHHEISIDENQYNQLFHNAMWKIFSTHSIARSLYLKKSSIPQKNIVLTGYPTLENIESIETIQHLKKDPRIKIIYAPHQEIWAEKPYSTFNKYANFMTHLAKKYQNSIIFIFKPHPILKGKLYNHPEWGVTKTEKYYHFWSSQENTYIYDGNYLELFNSSDALIHDCGSFILEYLYFKKPVMFLYSEGNTKSHYNSMGLKALETSSSGYNEEDIELFIQRLINNKNEISIEKIAHFYDNELLPYMSPLPSEKIINTLKNSIKNAL